MWSPALSPYAQAFLKNPQAAFLHCYKFNSQGQTLVTSYSREDFWELAHSAASVLKSRALARGDNFVLCFGGNHPHDLAFRLGATMLGAVPVTVNWQADELEQVTYKINLTDSRLLIHDGSFDAHLLQLIRAKNPDLPVLNVETIDLEPLDPQQYLKELDQDQSRIIIFTSGTTGWPKGARHSYQSYDTNRKTFDSFLELHDNGHFAAVVVNPLHHANATAITDWCLRNPAAELHLIQRYSTHFWEILAQITEARDCRIIVPATARHFDFLENLEQEQRLPISQERLFIALNRCQFLVGSAPVGPTTVERLQRYSGRIPTVRFGSTETCLQVMGIPNSFDESRKLAAFKRGWAHQQGEQPGYFIGRPHPPFTRVRVVGSIQRDHPRFMVDCGEGESGYLITAGSNLMIGYVADPEATSRVFAGDWYLGLNDVGFYLTDPTDNQPDFYWMSRESNMIIRGGANYSSEQIGSHLSSLLTGADLLKPGCFQLAVIGLKVQSEHEDSCCLTIDLLGNTGENLEARLGEFLKTINPKGFRPDYLRFAAIPHNFKGAVVIPQLTQEFQEWLAQNN